MDRCNLRCQGDDGCVLLCDYRLVKLMVSLIHGSRSLARWIDGRIHSSFSDETTARCHAEMEQVAEKQAWSLSTETQVEGYLWENLTEI